jgi:hypothetical protein
MPETPTATGATPESGATPEADQQDPLQDGSTSTASDAQADEELGEAGRRAIEKMRREVKRATARADAAEAREREREDAERSDLEKANRRITELEQSNAQLEHEGRARSAATEAGIPDLWDRLKGDSAEELAEDAKAMAERFGQRREQLDLGAGPREAAPATGSAAMNERIRRAARR